MIQVTITGQLSLLMLIESLESRGIPVVSGNTDGVVIKCPVDKEDLMRFIIARWVKTTNFVMEETQYAALYSRDVNNYIALKYNGEVKRKGCFAPASIDKNPDNEICTEALIEYLKHGTAFEHTVKSCSDIRKFLTLRNVNDGAVQRGEYIGKAIRYYHSKTENGYIEYKKNGNKVPNSDGAKPFMDLSKPFPKDIDYQWYVNKTKELFG
jgi:DNA polymerase elongation subunit (family B)